MAYTRLGGTGATFNDLMQNGMGIVTVMNAKIYKVGTIAEQTTAEDYLQSLTDEKLLCSIDTLKIANVTVSGPTKTITGGQYSNPLVKFGKTARLEMQDALATASTLEVLTGQVREGDEKSDTAKAYKTVIALHNTVDFAGEVTIVGDTFFIERKTGQQVKVKIIFYKFLPDSISGITQDADGDATVFDLNGDLLATDINVHNEGGEDFRTGVFYSIVESK